MDNYIDFYYQHKNKKNLPYPYSKKSLSKISSFIKGNVLEIGVGDGNLSSVLLDLSGNIKSYTGVDINKKFLDDTRLKLQDKINSIEMFNRDFMEIEFNKLFDTIISFEVIEHVKSPDKFLEKIYSFLKPNGIAVISTPNKPIYSIVAKLVDGGKDPTHISEMNYKEFKKIFSKYFYIRFSLYASFTS